MPKHSTPHGLAVEATPEQDTYERGNISRDGQDTAFGANDASAPPYVPPAAPVPTQPLVNINQGPQVPVEPQPGQMSHPSPVRPDPVLTLVGKIHERLDQIDAALDEIPAVNPDRITRDDIDEVGFALLAVVDRLDALEAPGPLRRAWYKVKGWFTR